MKFDKICYCTFEISLNISNCSLLKISLSSLNFKESFETGMGMHHYRICRHVFQLNVFGFKFVWTAFCQMI